MQESKNRVALIGIIVEDPASVEQINHLLHDCQDMIFGRMGVPHREKGLSVISIAIDGDQDRISALSGRLGAIDGVSTRTVFARSMSAKRGKSTQTDGSTAR
ncbi:MAG: TM1266 family iron-only hydrogenase system putative regulator [Anaerovoracaceae bacterium]|jgi:putative iron-only hydrogenase system regulator